MEDTLRKNEKCFIGMPSCGYGYESAKLCFVACPSDSKYILKLDIIKELVESYQYECHIALNKIDPGNFVFCTKICSKIIQAQFCIVFLDPSFDRNEAQYPNPNVHFEYGMMLSSNKKIIPLQDEKFDLPFNISPLDTVKYSESNFKLKIKEAISHHIAKFSEATEVGALPFEPEFAAFYNFHGFILSDTNILVFKTLFSLGSHLGFFLFNNPSSGEYKFTGVFDKDDPKRAIFNTMMLIRNITTAYEVLTRNDGESDEIKMQKYGYLINSISIDIVVSPFYKKEEIIQRIKDVTDSGYNYTITAYYRNDFKFFIENKYNEIEAISPIRMIDK